MKLLRYIFKRFIGVIPILILISFVSFELMNLAPGDPAEAILTSQGAVVTADVLESTRIEMGLDKRILFSINLAIGLFFKIKMVSHIK